MQRVIVTGGAGFIGSHFCDLLVKMGYKVISYDFLTYAGNMSNHEYVGENSNFDFVLGDICDFEAVNNLLRQDDIVVNFAAETHVDRSIKDPWAFLRADIIGLFNLIYISRKKKIKKFIQISTDEVYGPVVEGEVGELSPFAPASPYSASKASADLLVQSYIKTYGFPGIIIRPCNNFGERQYPEKLIPMIITKILEGKEVYLHGEGKEIREWIYVKDCCRMILNIMEEGKIGEAYNIGTGFRVSNRSMIGLIFYFMKVSLKKKLVLKIKNVFNRPGNDSRYAISSSKYLKTFENIEKTVFENALVETIRWYYDHKTWWDKVNLEANIYKKDEYLR